VSGICEPSSALALLHVLILLLVAVVMIIVAVTDSTTTTKLDVSTWEITILADGKANARS
jgi:hypothetical protein